MKPEESILQRDPTVICRFVDHLWWNKGMNYIGCFQAVNRMLTEGGKRPLSLTEYDQIVCRRIRSCLP